MIEPLAAESLIRYLFASFYLFCYCLAALCMLVAVLIFPAGWDAPVVREVCGPEADNYGSGQCGIRWAFILAIIGVVDCGVLSILAFVLGTRYVKHSPDQFLPPLYKGS